MGESLRSLSHADLRRSAEVVLRPAPASSAAAYGQAYGDSSSAGDAEGVEEVFLTSGSFFWGSGRVRVRTLLGSCVSIVMWHPVLHIGGMCHYLLPEDTSEERVARVAVHAEGAIGLFLEQVSRHNTRPSDYLVKFFGGGHMFPLLAKARGHYCSGACKRSPGNRCADVACQNVNKGRELLRQHRFQIAAESVGGDGSRELIFELWNGDVWVKRGSVLRPSQHSVESVDALA